MANSHLNPVLLSAYIDDEVSAEERTLVESHLVTCEVCQVELDGLRWTVNLFHQLPEAPLPRNFYVTEAMLEQPPVKKGWIEWLQSLFGGMQTVPIGVGAAVMALLLLMVIVQVQPSSTVSEPQIALAPLSTAPLANEEVSVLSEQSAAMSDDSVMEEAETESEESNKEMATEFEENDVSASSQSSAGVSIEENNQDHVLTEEESEVLFDAILASDEVVDEAANKSQPAETTRVARPQRAVGATSTIIEPLESAQQPLNTPTPGFTSTPSLDSALDSAEISDSAEVSVISPSPPPISSASEASGPEEPTPVPEGDVVSLEQTSSVPMILTVIGMLLLLLLGVIYWRKRSN